MGQRTTGRAFTNTLLLAAVVAAPGIAQHRGQYMSGLSATNSGVQPDTGFTYANIFYYSSSDRLKGLDGGPIPIDGQFTIIADLSTFVYVYKPKILGGNLESIAAIPIANASLAADVFQAGKPIQGGGGGLANTYFVPVQIGWHLKRVDLQTGYVFFAPTGRYEPGATNNTGTGYWTNGTQTGATIYLTKNKGTTLNVFDMYAWNTQQKGTGLTYGQNNSLDYSLLQVIPLAKDQRWLFQTGVVGYGQWQTSNSSRTSQALANTRWGVNALGFAANLIVPGRKVVLGANTFWEMGAYNTREGHVVMISGAFTF
jgi:hypothetical protein